MIPHRADVRKVVEALVCFAKHLDPREIVMTCTTNSRSLTAGKSKRSKIKSKKFLECLDAVTFSGKPNMTLKLNEHLQAFQPRSTLHGRFASIFYGSRPPERLNIYVLTNGMWDPSELESRLMEYTRSFYEQGTRQYHLGIQFIRFGSSRTAKLLLQRLDRLDRIHNLPM